MQTNIEPAANFIIGRVLPCLQAVTMGQVVSWLPVVERLVAILDRCIKGSYNVGGEEDVEGLDRFNRIDTVAPGGRRGGLIHRFRQRKVARWW